MKTIFYFLIFPGFLFTAVCGLLMTWFDRKLTARIQWRVGPPFYQPFMDFFKLLGKQMSVPKGGSPVLFLSAPAIALAAVMLASYILWNALFFPAAASGGDLIVLLYLFTIPQAAVIIGAFASRNPLASLGASR